MKWVRKGEQPPGQIPDINIIITVPLLVLCSFLQSQWVYDWMEEYQD